MSGNEFSAMLHKVGVNMGDHGETIVVAVEVDPDESVRSLIERLIPAPTRWSQRKYENFISLRVIQPADEEPFPTFESLGTDGAPF